MTSIGFHYFPDEAHYRAADLQAWLPELQALGARWLTLVGSLTRAVPEPFIRGLLEAGVEPIVHIPATPIRHLDVPSLRPLLQTYRRWGVKHVVIFAEPNTRGAWSPAEWSKTAIVERFLDILVPVLAAEAEAGLQPTFPALMAGGEYWDTSFLESALVGLLRRGLADLAGQLTFAVNLWTLNRPANWGAGGLRQWPQSKPYLTPPGSQDQRGFRLFDWYADIIQARLGQPRPLLCLAGGPCLGDRTDPDFPPTTDERHASCIKEIAQAVADNTLPRHLLNVNFWLLASTDDSPFAQEAWYRTDGTTLSAVDVLKQGAARRKPAVKTPAPAARSRERNGHKPIRHYLLLPTFEWGVSEWHWASALAYVNAHRPTCGFSLEEARMAEAVTIWGNEQGVSREAETALMEAGCAVERILPGRNGDHLAGDQP